MAAAASWRFDAIGTGWEILTKRPLAPEVRDAVTARIDAFDRTWSRFRVDSAVSALARGGGSIPGPSDAVPMLDALAGISDATEGAVSPLVGASLAALGYDAAYSLRDRGPVAAPADWRKRLTWHDGALTLRGPAVIDVGALGKGRLVDLVLDVLARTERGDLVVDASGDLAVRGRPQRIGLEHPFDPRRAIGVWEVTDAALCASAINRRSWPSATGTTLHHVLDARTGEPVRAIAATWAVAPDAMTADAAATALFFDGGPRLAHDWGVEWVRMTTDGRVEWSPGCPAELFVRAGGVGRTAPGPRANSLET
ncbi:FAD:protein FMN transferase [Microbacterium sp. M3]|uniref:FAD:protein FMN transferase n=1 Tax=Microbacterium arthrosphaerae TaxID=792652 RepID=A0ABU4GW89_9MICO|nr:MULTISPECIES: FAD:protein FMN transferase [Microbacterium]MDW4571275.1 FAD:protein FMN transferase [Microbacterium arthrosphaerae]MDW7605130.1 FAD:protein FMN transferase [Microbacterium sp. M3]